MSRETIRRLLVDLIAFLFIFGIFAFVYRLQFGDVTAAHFFLALPFILMAVFRHFINLKLVFIVSHLALAGILALLPFDTGLRAYIIAFMVVSTAYSIYVKSRVSPPMSFRTAFVGTLINITIFMILNYFDYGSAFMLMYLNASTLLIFIFVAMYIHIERLDFNLLTNRHNGRRNADSTVSTNNTLILLFVIVLAIGGGIIIFTPLGGWITSVTWVTVRAFMWILAVVLTVVARGVAFIFPNLPEPGFMEIAEFEVMEASIEPHYMGDERGFLFEIVVVVLAVVAIYVFILRKYSMGKTTENVKTRVYEKNYDTHTSSVASVGGFGWLFPSFRNRVKHPIRRAYIKKVRSHMKRGVEVMPHDTPDSIAGKIYEREDIAELTARYERVRYGNAP